jgi:hypothetical protein
MDKRRLDYSNEGNDMTQKDTKELTIEMWTYLAEHPEIRVKDQMPSYLWDKVRIFIAECPLCALFNDRSANCPGCPLDADGKNCCLDESPFDLWFNSDLEQRDLRARCAQDIVDIVSAWEPEEEAL